MRSGGTWIAATNGFARSPSRSREPLGSSASPCGITSALKCVLSGSATFTSTLACQSQEPVTARSRSGPSTARGRLCCTASAERWSISSASRKRGPARSTSASRPRPAWPTVRRVPGPIRTTPAWRSCVTRPSNRNASGEASPRSSGTRKLARPESRSSSLHSSVASNGTCWSPASSPVAANCAPLAACVSESASSRANSESPRTMSMSVSCSSGSCRAGSSSASTSCSAAARTLGDAGPVRERFKSSALTSLVPSASAGSTMRAPPSTRRATRGRPPSRGASAASARSALTTVTPSAAWRNASPRSTTVAGHWNARPFHDASSPRERANACTRPPSQGVTSSGTTIATASNAPTAISVQRSARGSVGRRAMRVRDYGSARAARELGL